MDHHAYAELERCVTYCRIGTMLGEATPCIADLLIQCNESAIKAVQPHSRSGCGLKRSRSASARGKPVRTVSVFGKLRLSD